MTYEGMRLKIQKYWRKGFANYRRKQLKNTDFTIISNNCWGGMIYESYKLPKMSPTVGMFFMASDYIEFLSHLKDYLAAELSFIQPQHSRWKEQVCVDKRFGSFPIGILKLSKRKHGIELFFLHYHSKQEAKEKWERRIKRIHWNQLLIKFNDQNACTEKNIRDFEALPYRNKVCFTVKDYLLCESVVKVKAPKSHTFIQASYEPFGKNRYIDINTLINRL